MVVLPTFINNFATVDGNKKCALPQVGENLYAGK